MTRDLDPILGPDEETYECVAILECEHCGLEVEWLYEVEDNDPSVGYRGSLLICATCRGRGRSE